MSWEVDDPRALVWRCEACKHEGFVEEFEHRKGCHRCPECKSNDVFSAFEPALWEPPRREWWPGPV